MHLRHVRLDQFLRSRFIETLPRLHRRAGHKGPLRWIDFRYVIESLRRNSRALLRAQLRTTSSPVRPGTGSGDNSWRRSRRMRPPKSSSMPSMETPEPTTWRAWSGICVVSYAAAC